MEHQTHLQRIDPTRNMQRFYTFTLEPTLFGDTALVRNWGRIGTRGQIMQQTFDGAAAAKAALDKLSATKRRRGYRQLPSGNFTPPQPSLNPCLPSD